MSYLILGVGLLITFFMMLSKSIFYRYCDEINFKITKRLSKMLKLANIAPVIVLFIIYILTITYLKTKLNIRLSHAWFVMSFWICDDIFFYIIAAMARIKKLVIVIPFLGMIISTCIAIYLTPLYHYEGIFQNTNIIIPNFFGFIMLITAYFVNHTLLKKQMG